MVKRLVKYASDDLVCKLLKAIPGVGPLTTISHKTSIDDPTRFTNAANVRAFLGLTPNRYQSREVGRNNGISKHGRRQIRSLLYKNSNVFAYTGRRIFNPSSLVNQTSVVAWNLRVCCYSDPKTIHLDA